MRLRLGEASDLIKNDAFLPMFRNRQKHFPEEFKKSVEIAKTKENPERYLSKIWGLSSLKKSVEWLKMMINRAKSKLAEMRQALAERKREQKFKQEHNPEGREKLAKLYQKNNLFGLKS